MTILLIAGLALLVTSALAVALARSITRPIHQLVRGAQESARATWTIGSRWAPEMSWASWQTR